MNPLERYIATLKLELERVRGLDWTPPEPPEDPPSFTDSRLKPVKKSALPQRAEPVPLKTVRDDELPRVALDYINAETKGPSMLLVRVPAGVGKTYAISEIAQNEMSGRVLWMAARHTAWDDLIGFEHFNSSFWHHWLGAGQVQDNGEPMCKYAPYMSQWQKLGYPSWKMCKMLCDDSGHTAVCPYATQSNRANEKQCILGMHNALSIGVNTRRFDLAVVDELAMQALIKNRRIPAKDILINSSGPVQELLATMQVSAINCAKGAQIRAKALFDQIGPILDDVYAQVDLDIGLPIIPNIKRAEDVGGLEYWFLNEFLLIAAQEHEAWRNGWDDWASRIIINQWGLHMLSKLDLWDKLPYKLIVLDATGKTNLYEGLYGREIIEYSPSVHHIGRIHQITGRLNSKKQLYRVTTQMNIEQHGDIKQHKTIVPQPAFYEAVEVMKALKKKHKAEKIGVICYKDLDDILKEEFGDNVLHFYGLRGTNIMAKVDLLFVLGSPTMHFQDIINTAVTMDTDRRVAFGGLDAETGKPKPLYKPTLQEYRLSNEALDDLAERNGWDREMIEGAQRVVGAYTEDELAAIHQQYSASELIQAVHRARVNSRDAMVYLLTSTPIPDEVLDGISDDPPIGPARMHWKTWLQLDFDMEQLPEGAALWPCDLAYSADVSEKYVKDNAWVDMILDYYADNGGDWYSLRMRDPRAESKRGRFPKAMVKGVNPAKEHLDTNSIIVMEKPENDKNQ